MPEEENTRNVPLVPAKKLLDHLNRFRDLFACPCCHSKEWGIQVMSISPNAAEGPDLSKVDLDLIMPRYLPGIGNQEFSPPLMQVLPVTCQVCGYVAVFDANIVSKEDPDE